MKTTQIFAISLTTVFSILLSGCDSSKKDEQKDESLPVADNSEPLCMQPAKKLRLQANKGDADCQYELGRRHEYGWKRKYVKMKEAIEWYAKAAEQGSAKAKSALSLLKKNSNLPNGETHGYAPEEFLPQLQTQAEAGDPEAMYLLARCYLEALGVERNEKKAEELLDAALTQGHVESMFLRGTRYANAATAKYNSEQQHDKQALEQGYAKAMELIRGAAEGGSTKAMNCLGSSLMIGKICPQNMEDGLKWVQAAADKHLPEAQRTLGVWMLKGFHHVEKNPEQGIQYILNSMEQGQGKAYAHLCEIHLSDEYGVKDYAKAVEYAKTGAEQGNGECMALLGVCHLFGYGVEKSEDTGASLLVDAIKSGSQTGASLYGFCLHCGVGTKQDTDRGINLIVLGAQAGCHICKTFTYAITGKAEAKIPDDNCIIYNLFPPVLEMISNQADAGNAQCLHLMRLIYQGGYIVDRDMKKSLDYLKRAADAGHMISQYLYAGQLIGDDKATNAEGISYMIKAAEQGCSDAQYMVGVIYFTGMYGVSPDQFYGARMLKNSARQGNRSAIEAIETFRIK